MAFISRRIPRAQSRFIAWSQVERFHWDGDILTIVPTSSVMAGSELGRPLLGGALRVPMNKRAQVENLLAGKYRNHAGS